MVTKLNKGQVAIFVILGMILVVVIIILFMLFRNNVNSEVSVAENPSSYIKQCVGDKLEELNKQIIYNGGFVNLPSLTKNYLGKNISFLCYTNINYARCMPVEPVLISHFNQDISENINQTIKNCFESLREELESELYSVEIEENNYSVGVLPEKIKIEINNKISFTKADRTRKIDNFNLEKSSGLYDFGIVAQEIIRQESLYCNSEYVDLMDRYKNYIITKIQIGDAVKIYTITDRKTLEEFKFAVRGCGTTIPSA